MLGLVQVRQTNSEWWTLTVKWDKRFGSALNLRELGYRRNKGKTVMSIVKA